MAHGSHATQTVRTTLETGHLASSVTRCTTKTKRSPGLSRMGGSCVSSESTSSDERSQIVDPCAHAPTAPARPASTHDRHAIV